MSTTQSTKRVPWISVPNNGQAVSIEHPCIVKNIEKGIDMIGGSPGIAQILEDPSKTLSLTFSPQDPAARTILSNNKPANNVLLRITVPTRTNRKRKRGSNDPFVEDNTTEPPKRDGAYLLRSMVDNVNSYSVDAITSIQNIHMWRSMPDFVYSTSQNRLVQDLKDKLLTQHYPSIRGFDLPRTYGLENTEAIPPPIWSTQTIPQIYTYRQNPAVKVTNDPSTGKRIVRNVQAAPKIYSYQVQWDTPEYPKVPMPDIPPLETQTVVFQNIVEQLRPLFAARPLWTRRALLNQLNPATTSYNLVRFCVAYVAFAIRSGPWRDTYCCLGVDPRTDPNCRFYQSVMLQLVPKLHAATITSAAAAQGKSNQNTGANDEGSNIANGDATSVQNEATRKTTAPTREERQRILEIRQTFHRTWAMNKDNTSHMFDGVSPISSDGKVWQLCDMTDPQLAALRDVHELHIRAICDTRYFGWYGNGTNAKIRVALKVKVDALVQGKTPDNASLEEFLKLPESIYFEGDNNQAITLEDPTDAIDDPSKTLVGEVSGNVGETTQENHQVSAPSVTKVKLGTSLKDWFRAETPTKQQLEWASLYRAFARTEPGKAPAAGGSGKGRLSKTKLRLRKSYRDPVKQKTAQGSRPDSSAQSPSNQAATDQAVGNTSAHGNAPSDPIGIDDDMDVEQEDDDVEMDEFEDGPEVADGEEILPSIEQFGFGDDVGEEELDLDVDIKLEENDEYGEVVEEGAEPVRAVLGRDGAIGMAPIVQDTVTERDAQGGHT